MRQRLWRLYDGVVLGKPAAALFGLAVVVACMTFFAPRFKLDASADSLVLENDDDLRYYRGISAKYGSDDFLVVTYAPSRELFTPDALAKLKALQDDLAALDGVNRVVGILNVPLLNSPHIPLSELSKTPRTLETPGVDLQLAKREFLESPLYRDLLLSRDGRVTALLAYLEPDRRYRTLLAERERLRALKHDGLLGAARERELRRAEEDFKDYHAEYAARSRERVAEVREVMDGHRAGTRMFLGGVSMIVADMINFIQSDLVNFGSAVTLFLILTLLVIFRRPRWIVMPMLCAGLTATLTIGLLGLLDWPVTVVSANFVALLLIITMSMTIHLVVRYRETQARHPAADKKTMVRQTTHFMFEPCVYTSLTTIVAFASLLVSGIRPVIDFGQIMIIGIFLAFVLVFTLFPAFLTCLPKGSSKAENDFTTALTMTLANFTRRRHRLIVFVAAAAAVVAAAGVAQLKVENRFIDYFSKDTEIYKGMLEIDRKLGGTTPLDLILDAEPETPPAEDAPENMPEFEDDAAFLDDVFAEIGVEEQTEYWLTPYKMDEIKRVHDYLDAQPEIGKVLSLATLIRLAEQLNNDQALGDVETLFLRKLLSPDIKRILLDPYLSEDGKQLRFNVRVIDSDKTLSRKELLERVGGDVENKMGYAGDRFRLTGMLVLYNNMLQSLYESQILTLGMVFLAIMLMFVVLFRSFALAAVAIAPNLLAAGLVLGFMGWRGIPLDMMTITIAAISVGIAVDNTIHYVVRFKREFKHNHNYAQTIQRCHGSIGKAVYYTSVTIIAGFSILSLSNFVPTIYFGLLTGLAMFAALVASLTLLPSLLMLFKPLGPGAGGAAA